MVKIEKLIPNPRNPNRHPEKQIVMLAKIIDAQGWRAPITVSNRSGFIVRGHGRLMAAQKLGLDKVPVDCQDYENEAAEWADLIADNRLSELSEIDVPTLKDLLQDMDTGAIDMELTAYTPEEIEAMMTGVHDAHEDDFDADKALEDIAEPTTKLGDIYKMGNHRLMCGDSTDADSVSKLMDGHKADMVFTDPPYGVSIGSKNQALNSVQKAGRCTENIENDTLSPDKLYPILKAAFTNCKTFMNDACALYATAPQGGGLGLMMMMMMRDAGLEIRHVLIWVKNCATFSIGRLDYDYQHEPIMFTWKKTHKRINKGEHKTSCWFIDKPRESKMHPTMKPVKLIENALLNSTEDGDRVLDIFGGSGSTLIACEQLNRKCYMMELDTKYCDVICRRWETLTGKKAEKVTPCQK